VIEVEATPHSSSGLAFPTFLAAFFWTMLVLVVQLGVVIAAVAVWGASGGDLTSPVFAHVVMLLGTTSTTATALTVCLLLLGRKLPRIVGWRACSAMQLLAVSLLVVPMAVITSEFANWIELGVRQVEHEWLHEFRLAGREGILALNQLPWWWVILFGCVIPGFGEELYWRGFLSRGLMRRYGAALGAIGASFLFGAVHIFPVQACGTFLLGMVLQYVFVMTRSLPAAIALHALNNAFAFSLARFERVFSVPGMSDAPGGAIVHVPWPMFASAIAASAFLLLILLRMRTQWRLLDGTYWSPGYASAELPPAELGATAVPGRAGWQWIVGALVSLSVFVSAFYCYSVSPPPS
jgi:membrane protease YdiL (CAAX protease family)